MYVFVCVCILIYLYNFTHIMYNMKYNGKTICDTLKPVSLLFIILITTILLYNNGKGTYSNLQLSLSFYFTFLCLQLAAFAAQNSNQILAIFWLGKLMLRPGSRCPLNMAFNILGIILIVVGSVCCCV